GYAIGYLLWGYLILFEVSLVSVIIVKFLIRFYFLAENIAKIVLPLLTIYLLKRILIWYLCRYFVTKDDPTHKRFVLKNRKFYFILNHFNFFFDCFLGSFVCFMRMTKSSLAALFFMPRLDYSIFGRFLERKDMGFISYVSFIHMEVNQTHPVKLAFCELLRRSLLQMCHKEPSSKKIRNKWFVFYTLIKNPSLRRMRKGFLFKQSLVPKVETFEHFMRRQKRKIFDEKIKRRSKSVPCITEEILEEEKSILNCRVPPTPPKRNRFINYNKDANLNSTISTENTTISLSSPNRNYQPVFSSSPIASQYKFSNRII
ncbi:stimulated by retinoic acid protein 6 -like protein, partial [Brachionus plicatilis]